MIDRRRAIVRAAAVAVVALALDQLTKALVRAEIRPGERIDVILGIDLVRVGNRGIAFGLFDGIGAMVTVLAAAAFTVLMIYFLATTDREALWLPIGLLAGGAVGNLIDRATEGEVTDFIDPPRWPALNVADIEITAGVILLLLLYAREPEREPEPAER